MIALAAAILLAELVEHRALAVAALAHREHELSLRLRARQTDDFVAFGQVDGLHAGGAAAHRAHLLLVEADRLSSLGRDQELGLAVGHDGGEQRIALHDLDADDALLAVILVLDDLGLS